MYACVLSYVRLLAMTWAVALEVASHSLFAESFHCFCDYMKGDRDTCIMYVVSNTVNSILFSLIVEKIVHIIRSCGCETPKLTTLLVFLGYSDVCC